MTAKPNTDERGIVLLIVLAMLGAISLSAILAVANSRRVVLESAFAREDMAIRQAEQAALVVFGGRLANHNSVGEFSLEMSGFKVVVRVRPEAAKLDLNLAAEDTLARFFSYVLVDPDRGVRLASAVADWRDADDLTRTNGAEAGAYLDASIGAVPRNAPFETVQELRLVLGASETLLDCVEPYLSVQSGTQTPDMHSASPKLAKALGLWTEVAQSGSVTVLSPLGSRSGDVFEVTMTIETPGRTEKSDVVYVVRALGGPQAPIAILDRRQVDHRARTSQSACEVLGAPLASEP